MKVSLRFHNGINVEERDFECDRLDIDVTEVLLWKENKTDESCNDWIIFAIDRSRFICADIDRASD